jgi:small ligand-binding sensory domain FIST
MRSSVAPRPASLPAASFAVAAGELSALARGLGPVARQVRDPAGAIVFVAGPLTGALEQLAATVRGAIGRVPVLVAAAPGVLCERGESEQGPAVTGVVWRGGTVRVVAAPDGPGIDEAAATLADRAAEAADGKGGTLLLFARPDRFSPLCLHRLASRAPSIRVVGAGTTPMGVVALDRDGEPARGPLVGLALGPALRPAIRATAAARLLAPLEPITETHGALVVRIGGRPALDVLTAASQSLQRQPLVLAALAEPEPVDGRDALVLRGIRGVDAGRRAVFVSDEVRPGMRIGFAVRDGVAARGDFERSASAVARDLAGSAPRFGLLLTCAARGRSLYGADDVETRAVRARFGDLPVAGMFSSFELAPHGAQSAVHTHAGVLTVFGAPS